MPVLLLNLPAAETNTYKISSGSCLISLREYTDLQFLLLAFQYALKLHEVRVVASQNIPSWKRLVRISDPNSWKVKDKKKRHLHCHSPHPVSQQGTRHLACVAPADAAEASSLQWVLSAHASALGLHNWALVKNSSFQWDMILFFYCLDNWKAFVCVLSCSHVC